MPFRLHQHFGRKCENLFLNESSDLTEWRTWLVNAIFVLGLIAMPVAMLFTFPTLIAEKQYALIGLDIAVCVVLIFRLFIRWRTYRFWAACRLLILYIMTITFYVKLGPHYTRSAWLVTCSVMAALFFGTRVAAITGIFSAVLLLSFYYFIGPQNPAWTQVYVEPFAKYRMFVVNTSIITVGTSLLVGFMLGRLNRANKHQQAATQELLKKMRA